MISKSFVRAAAVIAVAFACGCNVLNVNDGENGHGAGSQAFNPYQSTLSGSIRLALQNYKGCATTENGIVFGKGSANFPYPDNCQSFDPSRGVMATTGPDAAPPMQLLAGTTYFLNTVSLVDTADAQLNPNDAQDWITNQSLFKDLDWANLAVYIDEFQPIDSDSFGQMYWHKVHFANANWMLDTKQTFTVDVLDADGNVRNSVKYNRGDFLAENFVTQHTSISWSAYGVAAPLTPGDLSNTPAYPFFPPLIQTDVRIDLGDATNPFNGLKIDSGLKGDGALRLTWSALPNQPFYWPVHFVDPNSVAKNCFASDGKTPTACSFGMSPNISFSEPANGSFYQPGEKYEVKVALKDSLGNYLHNPDEFPSWNEYRSNSSNGIVYADFANFFYGEGGSFLVLRTAGPLQNLRPMYDSLKPTFSEWEKEYPIASIDTSYPGRADVRTPTTFRYTVPDDAQPGTYVAMIKATRQFMGERFSTTQPFFFQVGQAERTKYPGRVGNCQLCHRGAISLNNLFHGLSVDNIEGCKVCHTNIGSLGAVSPLLEYIHRIHMTSQKFPREKRDCTVCHLTRESATRPSIELCGACHPNIHGNQYFEEAYSTADKPNRFSNCAQACHVVTTPSRHILPAN